MGDIVKDSSLLQREKTRGEDLEMRATSSIWGLIELGEDGALDARGTFDRTLNRY